MAIANGFSVINYYLTFDIGFGHKSQIISVFAFDVHKSQANGVMQTESEKRKKNYKFHKHQDTQRNYAINCDSKHGCRTIQSNRQREYTYI